MIKSMTGFGRGEANDGEVRYEVELRGVNHRFLEVRVRLPQEVAAFEGALRSRVAAAVQRGRIDVTVNRAVSRQPQAVVTINREVISRYLEAATAIASEFRVPGALGLESLLALPGAVRVEVRREEETEAEKTVLLAALDQALVRYEAGRSAEGERLGRDLDARLAAVGSELEIISREAAGLTSEFAAKLRKRLAALLNGAPVDEGRLAQELAYLADRSDITEEIVRLGAHLRAAREHLAAPEAPAGKPLDFLIQEMHREANTVGSKAESLAISQAALRIKAEVEKLREQVQNIE